MDRYEPSRHRTLFGIAAVAMTALTIAATVFVPVGLSAPGREATTLAKPVAVAAEIAIDPACIEVVAYRETTVAATPRDATAKRRPHG